MSQEQGNPGRRIESVEVAEIMAHGERPHRDTELAARKDMLAAGKAAEVAGAEAANSWLRELSGQLGEYGADHATLREQLLSTRDTAYTIYTGMLETANTQRGEEDKLPIIGRDTINRDIEAALEKPTLLAELQASIDHFTEHPEANSPKPGFRILIVPEGMTDNDNEAVAHDLQTQLDKTQCTGHRTAHISPNRNSPINSGPTSRGYALVFAPTHYNVPKAPEDIDKIPVNENGVRLYNQWQTGWMGIHNRQNLATKLRTPTDSEATAFIASLLADGQLPTGSHADEARFHRTYSSRFDRTPVNDCVESVFVHDDGALRFALLFAASSIEIDCPARALAVSKA